MSLNLRRRLSWLSLGLALALGAAAPAGAREAAPRGVAPGPAGLRGSTVLVKVARAKGSSYDPIWMFDADYGVAAWAVPSAHSYSMTLAIRTPDGQLRRYAESPLNAIQVVRIAEADGVPRVWVVFGTCSRSECESLAIDPATGKQKYLGALGDDLLRVADHGPRFAALDGNEVRADDAAEGTTTCAVTQMPVPAAPEQSARPSLPAIPGCRRVDVLAFRGSVLTAYDYRGREAGDFVYDVVALDTAANTPTWTVLATETQAVDRSANYATRVVSRVTARGGSAAALVFYRKYGKDGALAGTTRATLLRWNLEPGGNFAEAPTRVDLGVGTSAVSYVGTTLVVLRSIRVHGRRYDELIQLAPAI